MNLTQVINKMRDRLILVIGDAILDKYVFGRVERLCPEAPVVDFVAEKTDNRNGGAAHVTDQLLALNMKVHYFYGEPVSIKTRYMAGSHMLLRVSDDKKPANVDPPKMLKVIGNFIKENESLAAIVISDYAKGWVIPTMCQHVIELARKRKIPVIVDPKGKDWDKYKGCDLICPNMKELKEWQGTVLWPFMLLKCGEHGLSLFTPSGHQDFPAQVHKVFDVTGAGDTVVAVAAATLAAGGTHVQAAVLSNLAAGWCVGEVGTAVCKAETLLDLVGTTEA